jgi:tetratricopeptide (TPR) repeat protein
MKLWWAPFIIAFVGLAAPLIHAAPPAITTIAAMRERPRLEAVIAECEQLLQQQPNDPLALTALGVAYHNLGGLRVGGASAKAADYLERARAATPDDASLFAYLGSARTMQARDSWNPLTKLMKIQEGTDLLDQAVAKAPDNLTARLIRANNSLRLPAIFNRRHFAKTDFEHVLRLTGGAMLPPPLLAEIHVKLGDVYKEAGDEVTARQHWSEAAELAPDSEWGGQARARR